MPIAYKNENVGKAATAENELKEIRTALDKEAKTGDKEAKSLLKKFDAAKEKGEEGGRQKAIKLIQYAINHDPSNFILSLFKDLEPDSSYSSLDAIYHELQQLESKSSLPQSLKTTVHVARSMHLAKGISEQEQTFIDQIKQAINDSNIKDVVAWMTMTKLLNEYVLEPARENGHIEPADAKKILQSALNKLTHHEVPPQGGTTTGNKAEENKGGTTTGNKAEENKGEATGTTVFNIAEGTAVSELLAEMSKREASIEKLITGIENADTKLLQKANAAILQFSAESQAILNKVDLSDKEKEQLQKLQEQLNSAVEAKAKELKVGTKTLTVSDKHLKTTEEHIDNLMKRKEEEYREVITNYHNTVIKILAEEFNIPKESIDETLEERISRHTTLGGLLRNRSKGESESPTTAKGFNIENKQ